MILRHLEPKSAVEHDKPRPAFAVFLESQQEVRPPFGLVLQTTHSELAGELAKYLLPEAFGELPPEVSEAAWKHDFGWEGSDAAQTGNMPDVIPKPFPAVPEDELPSWRRSLELAEGYAPLTRVLIGRHFAALSNKPSPRHEEFCAQDAKARAILEATLGVAEADLERWAGAVGFCDLVSLVLSSGVMESCVFPLAHPASAAAEGAREVTLTWREGNPVFSEPVFRAGAKLRVEGQQFDPATGEVRPLALHWTVQ